MYVQLNLAITDTRKYGKMEIHLYSIVDVKFWSCQLNLYFYIGNNRNPFTVVKIC